MGWLQFAGVELVNSTRASMLSGGLVRCGCATLPHALGDDPDEYRDVTTAPWFDITVPDSKDFFGFAGLEYTGDADGTAERGTTEVIGDGGVLGAPRAASRELEVTVLAVAATEAGLSYGLGWLEAALGGSACHTGCSGDTLCVYAACPPKGRADALLRYLGEVGLTDGPTRESVTRLAGGWIATVSFTVTAGNPWWWQLPRMVFDQTVAPDYSDVVADYDILGGGPCPDPPDCLDSSPYCTGSNAPWPDEPFPGSSPHDLSLLDPCYPTAPFTAARALWRVPRRAMPTGQGTVPIVELRSGSLPLHRITVRWYSNPTNRVPTGTIDRCRACAELTIPWIPANTTLTIDGRSRSTTVNCRDLGRTPSGVTVYGPRGGPFDWPVFPCSTPLIAELIMLNNSLTPDTTWRVSLAARTGAV
ncbi:hypothetical protein IL38_24080 [Actinopolyspora erythraea]|uniref:Minor tail protein n=1 Tax=Actinopolyspora erythraea TaxID=414996 RepID=A0ABR4WYR2_9ACTN|nr:hypothetical protein IL38_24080 [Actinopolyspora erythraea]